MSGGLPDPLAGPDGQRAADAASWIGWRRAQVLDLFRAHVFGREPGPGVVAVEVMARTTDRLPDGARRRVVELALRGPAGVVTVPLLMYLPADDSQRHPAMLLVNNRGRDVIGEGRQFHGFWPADHLVWRGYAAVAVGLGHIVPDADVGFARGVHTLLPPSQGSGTRPDDAWATISAWAWGACRVLDYLVEDPDIDAKRIAVVGHSRGGKAALWAGALDERFAMVVSNDSGCTGAAISRGKRGERVADINRVFPYWFAKAYHRYGGHEDQLPVDQHELLALIAPRLLYVASAAEDTWADPDAELRGLLGAEPVYRLFGPNDSFRTGMGSEGEDGKVRLDHPVHDRNLGYHRRTGGHDLTRYDWSCFLDFATDRL